MVVRSTTGVSNTFTLPAVERQARPDLRRRAVGLAGIVDLVVEEQLLILADDVGQVRQKLHAVADQRVVGLAFGGTAGAAC